MRALYIGPAPFWYHWFSIPDNLESSARAYVDSVGAWFQFHNDQTRNFAPWKVRMCALSAAGAVLADPPCMREWSWPLPPAVDEVARSDIRNAAFRCLIGSAFPLEPHVQWGPMSLAYYVREEYPVLPNPNQVTPWRLWFGGPLRGQSFYRNEIDKNSPYGGGAAGIACRETICLDGIIPPSPTDDFLTRKHSWFFW